MTSIIFDGFDLSKLEDIVEENILSADWSNSTLTYSPNTRTYGIKNIPYAIADKKGRYDIWWTSKIKEGTITQLRDKQDRTDSFKAEFIPTLPDYVNALTVARLTNSDDFADYLKSCITQNTFLTMTRTIEDKPNGRVHIMHEGNFRLISYENTSITFSSGEFTRDQEKVYRTLLGQEPGEAKKNLDQLANWKRDTFVPDRDFYVVLYVQDNILRLGARSGTSDSYKAHYIKKIRVIE